MGKVCIKHRIGLLQKMVENMFFLDSEHAEMRKCFPPKFVRLFILDAWFLKIILLGYDFFVAAAKVGPSLLYGLLSPK